MDRRNFLAKAAGFTGTAVLSSFWGTAQGVQFSAELASKENRNPTQLATDETYWEAIRKAFTVSEEIVNLNNGGASPQPKVVQDAVINYYRLANELPSYNLWRKIDGLREPLRTRLAALAGCKPTELAINRNATEGLETVIFGLPLKAGDEVVLCRYDYPSMIHAWDQRAHRDGIKLKWVELDVPMHSGKSIIDRYISAITPQTKLIHLTHIMNWTGQVIPVGKIGKLARKMGVEVMVDGAHSFSHIDFSVAKLHCDYFATSLHKWLCAPFGTGFLYVRESKISKLYPMYASLDPVGGEIQKFEHLGTRSLGTEMGIAEAIDFQEMIGMERKAARLNYLRMVWMDALKDTPGIRILTSNKPNMSAGMGLLDIEKLDPAELHNTLFNKHQFLVSPVNYHQARGIRVSPHIYTRINEMQRFIETIQKIAAR
ncbi:MAG: aminotransferase class V-fold PLP-dependent enzyme [Saprospiraceae bacterium]|nr:aminotransferase class V-fold PLP-dependent enzyme [Saprospiraceae bacterium]